jgi:drug/metabolite transporter (DMT)-like permease
LTALPASVKGILLMGLAMATFAVLDASAKDVMRSLPHDVAVFFRYFLALFIAVYFLARGGGLALLQTRQPLSQVLRGLMLLSSTVLNFTALTYLQLAQTAAISFMIPLWICALSGPLLGEHVGWRRWVAVAVGFIGVLVIMRPGTMTFHWAMFLSLGATLAGALYNILTRKVGGVDRVETSLFYVCLVGSLGAALPLPWHWQMPNVHEWIFLLAMGTAGGGGHYLLTLAHRLAPASLLAPFTYTQILWMILLGFVMFGDLPDHWTLIGAGIVIASGLFVFMRERQLGEQTTLASPAD